MSTTVFFRDDDIGELTPATKIVVELLLQERIPCNYLVIPRYLTAEAARYMCEQRRNHPGLIELNQHGYLHEQVIRGTHDWSEFAGGRPYEEQLAAIAEGKRILEDMLGDDFSSSIFTPPCHKYDGNTLRAIAACGFTVFSAGITQGMGARIYYGVGHALRRVTLLGQRVSYHGRRDPATGLIDISTAINIDEEYDRTGNRMLKSFDELRGEWERAKALHPIVGFLIHHEQYSAPEKVETLKKLIALVRNEPGVEITTIERIAERMNVRRAA